MQKKRIITVSLICLFFFPLVVCAYKSDIVISPTIIDKVCKKRDLLEYSIKIKNNSENKAFLYAFVNDISEEGTIEYKDPTDLSLATSLMRWIEFRRGVIEIDPGEEVEQPLKIKVNFDAPPGKYHARIALGEGTNIDRASESLELSPPELLINIDVEEHVVEKAEIVEFKPIRGVFTKSPIGFSLKIKNIGNTEIEPQGEVVIYSKGGKELASVNFNEENHKISPDRIVDFPISLEVGEKLGRFKAKLRAEYGQDRKDLQDVVYFLLLSKGALILIGFIILILVTFLATAMSRRKYRMAEKEEYVIPQRALKKLPKTQRKKTTKKKQKLEEKDYIIDLKSR